MMIRTCVVLAALGSGWAASGVHAQQAAADAAVDRTHLEQRLVAVETLLEKSSAAKQVDTIGDAAARQKRENAREIYRQARAAFQAGQYARSSALLPEASVQMFEAVRLSAPGEIAAPKVRADYAARLESVNSLHAALRRVASEKSGASGVAETSRNIEQLIGEANQLVDEGKIEAGRAALDRAYLLTRAAVSSLRSGDTLVRSLHFETKKDEFYYEVDRNDTHQMLVKVLLDGKPRSVSQQSFMEKALQLRTKADAAAAAADHAAAVQLLEDSTREMIRVIRSAGVYIPG